MKTLDTDKQGKNMMVFLAMNGNHMRTGIIEAMRREGFDLRCTSSAETAAVMLETIQPDIILLDTDLRDGSGLELARLVRNQDWQRDIPIIMVSGRSDTSSKLAGFLAGANRYVAKPYSAEDIMAQVRSYSEKRRSKIPAFTGLAALA